MMIDVIHTVGSRNNEKQVLANCYRHCLELCQHHRIRTVAIPCIATGAFSFDPEDACKIALSVVRAFLMMDIAFGRNSVCLDDGCDVHVYWHLQASSFYPSLIASFSAHFPVTIPTCIEVSIDKMFMDYQEAILIENTRTTPNLFPWILLNAVYDESIPAKRISNITANINKHSMAHCLYTNTSFTVTCFMQRLPDSLEGFISSNRFHPTWLPLVFSPALHPPILNC